MKIKINGVAISQEQSLLTKFEEVVKETNDIIQSKNREIRRSKPLKTVVSMMTLLTTLGMTTIAKANTEPIEPHMSLQDWLNPASATQNLMGNVIGSSINNYIEKSVGIGEAIARKDTVVWKMNDWMQHVLLNTHDFFNNSQILTVFNSTWYICMSFVTILITKKGFDMIKAKVLGTTSLGLNELIIRLLACVLMTYLSLDIMQIGIKFSNLTIQTLFGAIESHLIPYKALEDSNTTGVVFWFIGYCIMFVILSLQYWVRQLTVVLLGVITPVANMSWVVDGGAMLGTLMKEFVTLLTTPLVHAIVLGLGSVIMFEVSTMTGNTFIDSLNSIMIGFSTMFMMVFTPAFLRKFTSGSINPIKPFIGIGKGVAGNAIKLARLLK